MQVKERVVRRGGFFVIFGVRAGSPQPEAGAGQRRVGKERKGKKMSERRKAGAEHTGLILLKSLLVGIGPMFVGSAGVMAALALLSVYAPGLAAEPALYMGLAYAAMLPSLLALLLWIRFSQRNAAVREVEARRSPGHRLGCLALGLALGTALNLLCLLAAWLHGDIGLRFEGVEPPALLFILAAVLIQSGAEELLCRGVLYHRLYARYRSLAAACIGNTLFFAALHLANPGMGPLPLLNLLLCGLFFSVLYGLSGSLSLVCGVHTAWNFTQNIIFGLPNSGNESQYSVFSPVRAKGSWLYDVDFGLEGAVSTSLLFALLCLGLCIYGAGRPEKWRGKP